jgi:uncharacterized protein (TIGR00251 family)
MRKQIKVVPNSKNSGVAEKDGVLIVRVKEPAEKNRANAAVIKLLSKHFNSSVRIVSGFSSRKKAVEIED